MNPHDLTTSEVIVLCGERFVDHVRNSDSSSERTLHGQKTINAERLAVAAIRGAIITNLEAGVLRLSWQSDEELKARIAELYGVNGKILGAITRLPFVQSRLDKPVPHLEPGSVPFAWPEGTLEVIFADLEAHKKVGVTEQIRHKIAVSPSGAGVVRNVKEGLLKRGLLEQFPRGFGLLMPGFKLLETTRGQLEVELPKVEAMLRAAKRADLEMWDGLEVVITRALTSD